MGELYGMQQPSQPTAVPMNNNNEYQSAKAVTTLRPTTSLVSKTDFCFHHTPKVLQTGLKTEINKTRFMKGLYFSL